MERCLAALHAAVDSTEEIIVVDEPVALGPAAPRNEGARRSVADLIVFVDSDLEVHPDAFQRIRAAFDEDPELVAMFGSYDDDPRAAGLVSGFRNLSTTTAITLAAGPQARFGRTRRKA